MKYYLQLFILLFWTLSLQAQIPSGDLLVVIHSLSDAEMNSLNPEVGSLAFNTTDNNLYVYKGAVENPSWNRYKSDGTETYLIPGENIIITGNGSDLSPYIVKTHKAKITDNGDDTFTFSNGIDPNVTFCMRGCNKKTPVVFNDELSFSFSMRRLYIEYEGPLIRLRREVDNVEKDFFTNLTTDLLDINAIDSWGNGSDLKVVKWYDQSNQNRDAIEVELDRQPLFLVDNSNSTNPRPYFIGDGINDRLTVETSIQILTDKGANGSVLFVAAATVGNNHSFGTMHRGNRWSGHINWGGTGRLYVDLGRANGRPRSVVNKSNVDLFKQYTFIRRDNGALVRRQAVYAFHNSNQTNIRCTLSDGFGILWSAPTNSRYSKHKFTEMILYNTDISDEHYRALEQDQITYWGL